MKYFKKLIILICLFIFLTGCALSKSTITDIKKPNHTFQLIWDWNGDSNLLAGYNVYRKVKSSKEDFVKVNKYLVHEKKYEDKIYDYNKDLIYCYSVSAVGKDGQESKSKIKCSNQEDVKN